MYKNKILYQVQTELPTTNLKLNYYYSNKTHSKRLKINEHSISVLQLKPSFSFFYLSIKIFLNYYSNI